MNSPLATTFPAEDTGHPPLLDPTALDALLTELDEDQAALDGFLAAFTAHWPERLRRTEASVAAQNRLAVHDCALSIKVSGEMVGAMRLSAYGSELESLASSGAFADAAVLVEVLRTVGEQTLAALATARGGELAA